MCDLFYFTGPQTPGHDQDSVGYLVIPNVGFSNVPSHFIFLLRMHTSRNVCLRCHAGGPVGDKTERHCPQYESDKMPGQLSETIASSQSHPTRVSHIHSLALSDL